jgi:hypothetical protein
MPRRRCAQDLFEGGVDRQFEGGPCLGLHQTDDGAVAMVRLELHHIALALSKIEEERKGEPRLRADRMFRFKARNLLLGPAVKTLRLFLERLHVLRGIGTDQINLDRAVEQNAQQREEPVCGRWMIGARLDQLADMLAFKLCGRLGPMLIADLIKNVPVGPLRRGLQRLPLGRGQVGDDKRLRRSRSRSCPIFSIIIRT